jgi:hypothetical protein
LLPAPFVQSGVLWGLRIPEADASLARADNDSYIEIFEKVPFYWLIAIPFLVALVVWAMQGHTQNVFSLIAGLQLAGLIEYFGSCVMVTYLPRYLLPLAVAVAVSSCLSLHMLLNARPKT